MSDAPKGCVMICTDDKGRHVATVTDFERQGYGGFTLWEAQRIRCRDRIGKAVVSAYCSNIIADVIDRYDAGKVLDSLKKKGWTVHEVYVGYNEEPAHD